MSKSYDVIVIGSGTAGQTAAYKLHENGLRVGVVESSAQPGGICALAGCQAKKWFFEGAETVARSRHLAGIGISQPAAADWTALRDAKNRFTSRVPSNTIKGLKEAGMDFIQGQAQFVDSQTIMVGEQQFSAQFVLIATGAVPMPLPIDGADQMITSSQFLELSELPRRIVFIGGGFISFEFSHFAARLGPADTRCTILEAADRPLNPFDAEMVDLLTAASKTEGI
jgi:glutathione reductase (NADPH)